MEDEDVDCVTKIDTVADMDKRLPCISKEVNDSSESIADSPIDKEISCKNLVRLKSLAVHQEKEEIQDNVSSDVTDCSEASPKKVNGDVSKSESIISEDNSYDCWKSTNDELKSKENPSTETEHPKKRKHVQEDSSDEMNQCSKDSEDSTSPSLSPVGFRGFKKRKLSEPEEDAEVISVENEKLVVEDKKTVISFESNKPVDEEDSNITCEPVKPKVELRRSARNANLAKRKFSEQPVEQKEENGDQLTEYAQYLGLQPTVKFKCGRCGEKHFQSMASLNAHQKICSKSGSNALVKPTKPPGDSNLSTNFRITRKVYLCSACGTYYENWKLFLHMRDMHKRHICLFCLGMFSIADKLAEHLLFKHNVHEKICKSPEEFLNLFKGSCYLTCCSCEKMFTEREDFFDHQCKDSISTPSTSNKDVSLSTAKDLTQRCNLCGILCGHFQSCTNVHNNKLPNAVAPSTSVNSIVNPISTSNINLTKFYIPVPASVQKEWNNKNVQTSTKVTSDKDEYYDMGNAASFCHVDMANDSDNQLSPNKLASERRNTECRTYSRQDNHKKSPSASQSVAVNSSNEMSSTNLTSNEVSLSSDESVPEKTDTGVAETCKENTTHETEEKLKSDLNYDGKENKDKSEDENDADDEQNSSEEELSKMSKSPEKPNSDSSCSETEVDKNDDNSLNDNSTTDKKDEVNLKNNSIVPCYIVLNRVDENKTQNSEMDVDAKENINRGENLCVECTDEREKIDENDMSININDDGSSNLRVNNSFSNESCTSDTDFGDSSLDQGTNPVEDTKTDEILNKEGLNVSSQVKISNRSLSVENGFESNILDKSDESEDSDKLSVVLSDDGLDDNEDSKTNDEFSESGLDNTLPDHQVCSENEPSKQAETSIKNDGNVLYNGNESVDDSVNLDSEDNTDKNVTNLLPSKEDGFKVEGEKIQLANEEVTAMALTLEDKMDNLSSQFIIKECVRTSCTTCSYCSHAVKIGVNGKQLALHLLAEHRYMPVKNETVEDVIERLKKSLEELQDTWFNTDSYDSSDKSCFVSYDHTYECFQCNYVANLHKDLFSHKRKVHQKSTIYCCMCKANFHSYSELLCHMCPGLYVSKDIQFRCCFCELDRIPSAFRLMVHLRKTHHTCDICLEVAGDQQKLSTHMWKHKLHHLCYRCGISYRNKPDITKHLFWKHGTESVLCKKCLQKKWPHVYHFCIPPLVFICEECNLSFSKAVALKVHKRLHCGDLPYACATCEQRFVSKKLLLKHEKTHNEAAVEDNSKMEMLPAPEDSRKTSDQNSSAANDVSVPLADSTNNVPPETEKSDEMPVKQHKKKNKKDKEKKIKPVVDVYDLPPLNLSSESDDSDDEKEVKSNQFNSEESQEKTEKNVTKNDSLESDEKHVVDKEGSIIPTNILEEESSKLVANDVNSTEPIGDTEENAQPIPVLHGIWDSFHSYKAEQEKRESLDINKKLSQSDDTSSITLKDVVLGDHDYCKTNNVDEQYVDDDIDSEKLANREHSSSIDHDYCTLNNTEGTSSLAPSSHEKMVVDTPSKKKQKSPKKKSSKQHNSSSSSDSSSDSDSSTGSCSCGTNCSCSSSSSNSSSSSSSDSDSSSSGGRQHNSSMSKREKKKDKLKSKKKEDSVNTSEQLPAAEEDPVIDTTLDVVPEEPLIRESDLETDETSTDEEFYDQNPQRLANQLLAEKRNQLGVPGLVNNGNVSPPVSLSETPLPSASSPIHSSPKIEPTPPFPPEQVSTHTTAAHPQSKRKVKSKKRKKSSQFDNNRRVGKPQNLLYESSQPSTSFSMIHGKQLVIDSPRPVSSPGMTPITNRSVMDNNLFQSNQQLQQTPANSESYSSKRHSKRRRIRNKFYGYSSEEDDEPQQVHHHPPLKWKKPTSEVNAPHYGLHQQFQQFQQQPQYHLAQPSVVPERNFPPKVAQQVRTIDDRSLKINDRLMKRVSTSDGSSSGAGSDEMDSGSDSERTPLNVAVASGSGTKAVAEKDPPKLLYCYCQCPYDEVSEMIACDGAECSIEWFHFECVGIMVPPKGKWYCPDCRKLRGLS